jgi:hypothetical protein
MPNPGPTPRLLLAVSLTGWLLACAAQPGATACPQLPKAAASSATVKQLANPPAPSVAATWLFQCCDGTSTWIGMLTLVEEAGQLHGAWLTDGDSHGSYVEGQRDGNRVQFWRRWRTGSTLHEQTYELTLSADAQRLSGNFSEPALDSKPHSIELTRGFVHEPRRTSTPITTNESKPVDLDPPREQALKQPAKDPKRPCNCSLVCYCGGVPPGPEHYEESARCGGSCKCRVCPPLP